MRVQNLSPGGWQIIPPVVKNIIIINVILAVGQFAALKFGIDLSDILGLHYWKSELFKPWQFITHLFMHGSPYSVQDTAMHLFSNMFALWIFGAVLENMWGPKRFLTFYLICGIGAALCHLAVLGYQYHGIENAFEVYQQRPSLNAFTQFINEHVNKNLQPQTTQLYQLHDLWSNQPSQQGLAQQSADLIHQYIYGYQLDTSYYAEGIFDEATVGASGAVFGVLLAFGYLFPDTSLYLYFLFPIKAKYFVFFYAAFELYSGIRNSAGDNIAHFAHLGGMLFAFILLRIWGYNKYRPR